MTTGEPNVPRRAFLGVAGSVATRGLVPGECNASRPAEHQERAPVVLEPVRRIAIEPGVLGPEWKLEFDLVADTSSPSAVMSDCTATKQIAKAMGGAAQYISELRTGGIRQCAELAYYAVRDGQRGEGYHVDAWVYESTGAVISAWNRTFTTAEEAGYVPVVGLGDAAFESVGGWSLPGKLISHRYNVVFSVVGFGPDTSARFLAEHFDRRIQELAKMPGH